MPRTDLYVADCRGGCDEVRVNISQDGLLQVDAFAKRVPVAVCPDFSPSHPGLRTPSSDVACEDDSNSGDVADLSHILELVRNATET